MSCTEENVVLSLRYFREEDKVAVDNGGSINRNLTNTIIRQLVNMYKKKIENIKSNMIQQASDDIEKFFANDNIEKFFENKII